MNKPLVLVVEDDRPVRNLIVTTLKAHDYRYLTAENGHGAIMEATSHNPDIVLLDLGLPDIDGGEVLERVRGFSAVPVIVISARTQEGEKVQALDKGADDYITKPFNNLELVARVKSQLRRYEKPLSIEESSVIKVKDLEIDTLLKKITVRGEEIKATATEYKILLLLASNLGRVFSIKEIYEKVWEEPFYKSENTVTVHIRRIREKIEINTKEPEYIKVVWGIGYKIEK